MNPQLKIRITSSIYSLVGLAIVGITGFLISPDFISWVSNTFKEYPLLVSFILYAIPEVVKAIRNYLVTKNISVGSTSGNTQILI